MIFPSKSTKNPSLFPFLKKNLFFFKKRLQSFWKCGKIVLFWWFNSSLGGVLNGKMRYLRKRRILWYQSQPFAQKIKQNMEGERQKGSRNCKRHSEIRIRLHTLLTFRKGNPLRLISGKQESKAEGKFVLCFFLFKKNLKKFQKKFGIYEIICYNRI